MDVLVSKSESNWRDLYRAAILELDPAQLPHRITDAESVLIARARELFNQGGDNGEETEDLDDAMCALHALRSVLNYNSSGIVDKPHQMKVA